MTRSPALQVCVFGAAALVVFLWGCAPADLPVVPRVDDSAYREVVRDQLATAYAAFDAAPRSPSAAVELGLVLHAYEHLAAAETAYRRARMLAPRSAHYAYLHAIALEQQSRGADAIEALRGVLALEPNSPFATARQIRLLFEGGKFDEAATLAAAARRKHPGVPQFAFLHARILAAQGNHDEAAPLFSQLLDAGVRLPLVLYAAAQSARAQGNVDKATALLEEHERANAGNLPAQWPDPVINEIRRHNLTATAQVQLAEHLIETGAPLSQAVAILERAIELDPEAYEAHISLVGLYGRLNNFARADAHYAKALALAPEVPQLHFNLGLTKLRQRSLAEARRALERTLQLDPQHVTARAVLGQVRFEQGATDDGIELIDEAITANPADPLLREVHAQVLLRAQRFNDVLTTLTAVPTSQQRQIARLVLRASAHSGLNDPAAAIEALKAAGTIADSIGATEQAERIRQAAARIERN